MWFVIAYLPVDPRETSRGDQQISMTQAERDSLATCERLVEEVWSNGRTELISELVSESYVEHHPDGSRIEGRDGLEEYVVATRTGVSDLTKHVRDTIVDGDQVVIRYTATGTHDGELKGIEPTDAAVEIEGVLIYRVEDGAIEEGWEISDSLGLLQQIGAIEL
jgi:steroid delta-isomerase-like uncharacterized protein